MSGKVARRGAGAYGRVSAKRRAGGPPLSKIFISHSSGDNFEAVAVSQWLAEGGWSDAFLDLDPDRGIAAGERWERALHEAAQRCEAIIFLVSRRWLASGWCAKEYALARALNKKLFAVLIEPGLGIGALPAEYAGTWQATDLCAGQDARLFRVALPDSHEEKHVFFSQAGLRRLKNGLDKAGLAPKFFAWPPQDEPKRAPYRGLRALEEADAGVFFGREAPIVVAADRLRGLREAAAPRLLVILGASGAGKSSFLRAGLLPRLKRDDAHFTCLAPIRPERAALSGENGLIGALQKAFPDRARGALRESIDAGAAGLRPLLAELTQSAFARTLATEEARKAPAIVLSIDQAEELFRADGASESAALLALVRDLTARDDPAVIVVFVIRSDSYDRLEHAPALEGLAQATLPLLPMPRGNFKDVIEGPAARAEQAGQKLVVEPELTQRLLEDIEKGGAGDALPLLAFALEQLYVEYGAAGALRLADFEKFGGMEGAIAKAVERAFARADADRRIPQDRMAREALLRRGLVPWLAGIDPETHSPRRSTALKSDIPDEALPLIELLVEERLLVADVTTRDGERVETLEPAHEAVLRQWGLLRGWLEDDLGRLATLEGMRRAARDWEANGKDEGWLAHQGERLAEARALDARPDLAARLDARDRAYLHACSAREAAAAAERERARAAELARAKAEAEHARAGARFARNLTILASVAALLLASLGAWAWKQRNVAVEQSALADARSREAEDQRTRAEKAKATADLQRQQADEAREQANVQRQEAVMRLAAADELLDADKARQMRQCIASTERMSGQPAPQGSRDFFVGRWHVDQGASSTYMDWRADGTCQSKSIFAAKNLFSGGATALDLKDDVCTWQYRPLDNGEFEIDYQSAMLGEDYPKQLKFQIVSPTRIHNPELNYDAFRILCPSDELPALRSSVADLQARADKNPDDRAAQIAAAEGRRKLGTILLQQNDAAAASDELSRSVAILTAIVGKEGPKSSARPLLAVALFNLGEARRQDHATAEARDAFRKAVDLGQTLIDEFPSNALARYQMVEGLYELNQVSEPPQAKDALRRAIAILDNLARRFKPDAWAANMRTMLKTMLDKMP